MRQRNQKMKVLKMLVRPVNKRSYMALYFLEEGV